MIPRFSITDLKTKETVYVTERDLRLLRYLTTQEVQRIKDSDKITTPATPIEEAPQEGYLK